jgi:serine/threonine-protein kinase
MAGPLTKAGRYELVGELGRGSMGIVYKGFDPVIGRTVAIKTMLPEGLSSQEFDEYKTRFQREAMAAGVLAHPNIITVYDFGEDNGVLYLAMEFLEGQPLEKIVQEQTVLPIETILPIYDQVCSALDHAHRNGIVHRDVKPANIMILQNGLVKMTDFGIAKMMHMGMTQAGQILGTPNYMSPEQVKGRQIDGRSDIFSLGVILYELVTGEKPFGGQNITTVIYKIINENPISPRELDAAIPAGLNYVISKALAKNPDDRYQSCRELAEDLRNYKNLPNAVVTPSVAVVAPPPAAGDTTQAIFVAAKPASSVPPAPALPKPVVAATPIAEATIAGFGGSSAETAPNPQATPLSPPPSILAARAAVPAGNVAASTPQKPKARTASLDETPIASSFEAPDVPVHTPVRRSGSSAGAWIAALLLLLAAVGGGYYVIRMRQKAAQQSMATESVTAPNPTIPSTSAPSTAPTAAPAPESPAPAAPVPAPQAETPQTLPTLPSAPAAPAAAPPSESNPHPKPSAPDEASELAVMSNVTGAKISIDGHSDPAWVTPHTIDGVAPGVHTIEISKDGYDTFQQSVTITAGQAASVQGYLSAPRAELDINTSPAGLEVTIDGKSYGPSPIRSTLVPGPHTYTIARPTGSPYQSSVTLKSGDIITKTVTIGAVPSNGIVEVHTTPAGATVTADGAPVNGQTPTSCRLAVGNHTLVISLPGYKPVEQQVTVSENATATVNVNLTSQ